MRKVWVAALLLAGCATSGNKSGSFEAKAETTAAKALVSDDQENQLGDQVYQELVGKGTKFTSDATVTQYLSSITAPLFAQANRDRSNVNWRLLVIDDPKTVNAFSTPGGRLYVYSGLINAADNDAEIAGVLGHEIGHEVAHHVARSLVEQNGLQAVADLALGKNPGLAGQLATNVLGGGALLAHSRGEETEADEYGARYAAGAGFDPNGLITFFQKLQKLEGSTPGVAKYLSDHPATGDRIAHLQQFIPSQHLSGANRDASRMASVKAHLAGGVATAPTPSPAPTAQTPAPAGSSASGTQTAPPKNVPIHH